MLSRARPPAAYSAQTPRRQQCRAFSRKRRQKGNFAAPKIAFLPKACPPKPWQRRNWPAIQTYQGADFGLYCIKLLQKAPKPRE